MNTLYPAGLIYVALGGGLGAVVRVLMSRAVSQLLGTSFPWGTLAVNVLGGLLMGLIVALLAGRAVDPALRLLATTGFLGGFTTFSAFSLETAELLQRGQTGAAFGYMLGSVVFSVLAVFAGLALAKGLRA